MALVLANRVQESATANTTVSFSLTGAVAGFQTFAVIGNTNTTFYSATDTAGNWEVGLGTYSTSGPTLTRTTIYASSNAGSAVTFSGTVSVFVTYPSGRSVNLDGSGNVSALGTVASGTWQGSTIGVAYGGTGVTTSSGANSVVLRDADQNITANRVNQSNTNTTAAGGTTVLTTASSYIQSLVGTGGQTYALPDATTLTTGVAFIFNNLATGTVTITDYATATIGTIPSGGAGAVFLTNNATVGGTWDLHGYLPEGVTFGTNALNLGSTVVSGGTWQGGTIQPAYGGTGLTTFSGANNALYSTGASTLTAGTLPAVAGGTGLTTFTGANNALYSTGATTLTAGTLPVVAGGTGQSSALVAGSVVYGVSTTAMGVTAAGTAGQVLTSAGAGTPTWTTPTTGTVTSVTGTSPVASSGGATPAISLDSGYGDTQNPYASKTANYVLAAPNGSSGVPTFRAIVAADIPTLNQNTTGTAGNVTGTVAIANGGTGQTTANAAFNALVPSQTSQSGKYLTTDGTNTSWATVAGGGGATITNDTTTATDIYPLLATVTTGTLSAVNTSNGNLLYRPSTGELKAEAMNAMNGLFFNSATIAVNTTVPAGDNAGSFGPITVASGITVTVNSGSTWTVV